MTVDWLIQGVSALWQWLATPTDSTIPETYLAVGVTASVVFFSLTLIPFEQYASRYTPALFRYLLSHHGLATGYAASLCLTLALMVVPFFSTTHLTEILALAFTLGLFLTIVLLWRLSVRLLDPADFLIPAMVDDIKSAISQAIDSSEAHDPSTQDRIDELNRMMNEALGADSPVDPQKRFAITRSAIKPAFDRLRTLKDFAAALLQSGQIELFRAAMDGIVSCMHYYFERRASYRSQMDDLTIDLSDEIKDLLPLAASVSTIHGARIIWSAIQRISTSSLQVHFDAEESRHDIAAPLLQVLEDALPQELAARRLDSSYEAIRALGDVALAAAEKGYMTSASENAVTLSTYALFAEKLAMSVVALQASNYVAKVFFTMAYYRWMFANYEYPYERILEAYESLLKSSRSLSLGTTDYVHWYSPDLDDRSASSIVRVCLFPRPSTDSKEYDTIVYANLSVTGELIRILSVQFLDGLGHGNHRQAQLYQSALWLLAFVHPQIATDLLIYIPSVQIPSDENRKRAREQLSLVRRTYFDALKSSWSGGKHKILSRTEILEFFISTSCVDVYLASQHGSADLPALVAEFDEFARIVSVEYKSWKLRDEDALRLGPFIDYLFRADPAFHPSARALLHLLRVRSRHEKSKLLRSIRATRHRGFPVHLPSSPDPWRPIIHRPLYAFNGGLFADLDEQIFEVRRR